MFYPVGERAAEVAVDDAMVVRQAEEHFVPYADGITLGSFDDGGHFADQSRSEDGGLRRVDDGRPAEISVGSHVGDRKGTTLDLIGLELARPSS